jgi:hypothetical protein
VAGKKSQPGQKEIEGTKSAERDEELHALGLEPLRRPSPPHGANEVLEKQKASLIAARMHDMGVDEYKVDGIELWLEAGKESVKVRTDTGEDEEGDGG